MSTSLAVASFPKRGDQSDRWRNRAFLLAVVLAVAGHGALWWYGQSLDREPDVPARIPVAIEVSLTAAPSRPAVTAQPPKPPVASPAVAPKPPAKTPVKAKPKPKPKPKPEILPAAKPEPAKPVETPPTPPVAESAMPNPGAARAEHSESVSHGNQSTEVYEPAQANAAYLHNPRPEYPAAARHRQWQGKVVVKVKVLADGRCGQLEVQQSSGHDVLDEAALEAVRAWRFVPAKRGGQATDSWVSVPIVFKLEQ